MKFAQYLNDAQTPEWKKAYIDYRGLKKRITAVRKAQQGLANDASGSDTPQAPPASPRSSLGSRDSTDIKEIPRGESPSSSPILNRRKSVVRRDNAGHSTGVQGRPSQDIPRRPSIFGRTKSYSRRFSAVGLASLSNGERAKVLPLHELMTHLGPLEIAFFTLLDAQLDKIDSFYTAREQEMMQRGKVLEEQLQELTEHRKLYLAANAKVPWAAALAHALRPTAIQLKVTRTISLSQSKHQTHRDSLCTRMRNTARALPSLFDRSQISEGLDQLSPQRSRHDGGAGSDSSPEQPSSPLFGPSADTYPYAKRKLKKAVVEHYRGLELLHNYRVLNLTGFRKALKKFEKVTKIPVQEQYLAEKVEKSAFASDKTLQEMMRSMETMFATSFVQGNKKKAMKRLRGGARMKSHHFSTWRSGLLLGLAVPAIVSGFCHAFEERTAAAMPAWEALLMVYGVLLIPTVFSALVGLNLLVWAKSRINYVFIFELNVSSCMDYREYFEIPSILLALLAYAFWLSFARIGESVISPTLWPLVWLGCLAIIALNPFSFFFRPSRVWLLRMIGRQLTAGMKRVEFTDFWLGDQFCSMVFVFSNLYFFGCVYAEGFTEDWQDCGLQSSNWPIVFVLAILPFIVRFIQSIRRFLDSGLVTHLINAGKYASGIVSFLMYYLWRHAGTERHGPYFIFYCLMTAAYSAYSLTWDFLMDWSLLRLHSPNFLLRPELVYSNHQWLYYLAIISNVLLRFTWLCYIPERGPDMFLRTFLVAMGEMLRRCQWNFYRLENEHLGNMDQYRVTREVPLPYLFDDPHRDSDRDDDDDELKSK